MSTAPAPVPASLALMKEVLGRIAVGHTMSEAQAEEVFEVIMSGDATPAQIGGLLMGLRVRGETVEEITGAARIMRAKALRIEAPPGAVDTCGTGGDGSGTFNISTAAAFVIAGCGVPVAKHGNRALSSKSGSADVLAALGIKVDADMALVKESLWDNNLGFLMAPRHHNAMRHVAGPRVELGTRTIFNLLGPLANPAGAAFQVMGVFASQWVEPIAEVLGRLGVERAWVVHGRDGLDELTTTAPSLVAEWKDGKVSTFEIRPEDAGLPRAHAADLKGGDATVNAAALKALLDGAKGAYRDIVLLNAAATLIVAGRAADLKEGVVAAAQSIDSGKARAVLDRMVAITNREV
ncbi:anthranilate phosphoribosyltransferase [Magnetospirillum moscoviense]|uniref:Anthranilate phosphoribosyltransferase n=2 Tax=Magnetospirillum moscoviense TaxID=1437059 RepID=A0A178N110_9PROT|nr:anthranilate phosphoribosyltransferase [Magnetospirillum moscoviense]MBF0323581.1 anthranilate phosphoribosyltransferase [Alphaproteobacteria bacterium]OAN64495.1 anthranilate phosphoribosyltransferase [Magnetospirillum moscoviense]